MSDQYNEIFNEVTALLEKMNQLGSFDLLETDESSETFQLRWLSNGDIARQIIISGQGKYAPAIKVEKSALAD